MKICACTISKNEEEHISKWLENTKEADSRVVVDTGSTDKTIQLLKKANTIVIERQFDPFRFDAPRNLAMDYAPIGTDWYISPDFDEWFSPNWRNKLEETVEDHSDCNTISYNIILIRDNQEQPGLEKGNKIYKATHHWTKPIHEYLECEIEEYKIYIPEITLYHKQVEKDRDDFYYQVAKNNLEDNDSWTLWFIVKGSIEKEIDNDILDYGFRYLELTKSYTNFRSMTMNAISKVFLKQNKFQEALTWAFRAVSENISNRNAFENLAQIAFKIGNFPLATFAASNCNQKLFKQSLLRTISSLI